MMRKSARAVLRGFLVATVAIGSLVTACSDESPPPTPAPAVVSPPPGTQQGTTEAPPPTTPSSPSSGGCEDLGKLVGNGLTAKLFSSTNRSVALPIANRPVPSRLAVIGVGSATALAGNTVALGAAANANYQSCSHCLVIALNCSPDSCDQAAYFYPRSGTATFSSVAAKSGQEFAGKFTDVVLEEVVLDAAGLSNPVPGGACLRVQELAFDSTAQAAGGTDAGTVDAGVVLDAGSGEEDDGGSDGTGGGGKGGDLRASLGL